MFDGCQSKILKITDITAYIKLQKAQETTKILKALNDSVHHEMLTPLKVIIDICQMLLAVIQSSAHVEMI